MMKRYRVLALLLSMIMLCGLFAPAYGGELATLGVYFFGLQDREDGTQERVKLEGKFRIIQNGEEIMNIQAGEESALLTSSDPVTVIPVMSSMPKGWIIPEEGVTCEPRMGGTVTVPFMVNMDHGADEVTTVMPEFSDGNGETEEIAAAELTPEPVVVTVKANKGKAEADATAQQMPEDHERVVFSRENVMTPTPVPAPTPVPVTPAPATNGGTLRVTVFNDANNNSNRGTNEKGVANVNVAAVAADGSIAAFAVTDSEGIAELTGLTAGKYKIRVEAPAGWGFSKKSQKFGPTYNLMAPSVELVNESEPVSVAEDTATECGVGIWKLIHVSGFCWLETEADGERKPNEAMLDGVHIQLVGVKNGLVYDTYSDAEGNWTINQVSPAFYYLKVYAPDGLMFTRYSRTGGNNRSIFTADGKTVGVKQLDMNDGESVEQQNVGFMLSSYIKGQCFLDANYNGIYDEGEQPLAGVKMQAIKAGNGELISESISGEDGTYSLSGLRANTYNVRCVLPEGGAVFTRVVATKDGNRFRVRTGFRETTLEAQVIDNAEIKRINVGAIYYASVSGTVYTDKDFSGTLSKGEKTEGGMDVMLLDADGNVAGKARTNGKGKFTFENVTPGQYRISMTAKEGYAFTRAGEGNVMVNLNGGKGQSELFAVEIGAKVTDMDVGMIIPATVRGNVFADANDNGMQDANETGMEGMTVELTENGEKRASTTVNRAGEFVFDSVMPGTYQLKYVLPERGIFAQTVKGGNTISGDGEAYSDAFGIKSADNYTAPLCGVLTLGEISGATFRDSDGNGLPGEDESFVSGVAIRLDPTRDDLESINVLTGDQGEFRITALHPDTYVLTVTFPDGMVMSRTDAVKLPAVAGTTGMGQTLELGMGDLYEGQMLGCVRPATLKGRVWMDENNNGLMDEGEKHPAGEKITVMDESNGRVFAELLTDADGWFETSGMIPGKFTVQYLMDEKTAAPQSGDSTFGQQGNLLVMNSIQMQDDMVKDDLRLGFVRYTTVSGTVWIDRMGETVPLSGARVALADDAGDEIRSMNTGDNGTYLFDKLLPGTYQVRTELPEGCLVVHTDDERLEQGAVSVLTEYDGRKGSAEPFDLLMDQNREGMDIGSVVPGALGDFCWIDLNKNGWYDGGEPGVGGIRIELVKDGETVMETVSDDYGYYWFREVYPADWDLEVTAPAELKPTVKKTDVPVLVSVLDETDGDLFTATGITVRSNESNYNADLGFALRKEGEMPDNIGKGKTQDWTMRNQK